MIRVLILLVGLLIIGVLFLSKMPRQRKIIVSSLILLCFLVVVAVTGHLQSPKVDKSVLDQVAMCGVSGKFSYRTDYSISLCIKNNSPKVVDAVLIAVTALDCQNGECKEVQTVQKRMAVKIKPQAQSTFETTISFNELPRGSNNAKWVADIQQVWAVKQ